MILFGEYFAAKITVTMPTSQGLQPHLKEFILSSKTIIAMVVQQAHFYHYKQHTPAKLS